MKIYRPEQKGHRDLIDVFPSSPKSTHRSMDGILIILFIYFIFQEMKKKEQVETVSLEVDAPNFEKNPME